MNGMNQRPGDGGVFDARTPSDTSRPVNPAHAAPLASIAALAREYWWLLRGELYRLRLQWFWYLVVMSFAPLVTMAFLW